MTELVQIVAGWPIVLSMAAAVAAQSLRAGRRRSALNEALHELRRPLQAVALAAGPQLGGTADSDEPIELAAAALERLDREINGGPLAPTLGPVDVAALARSAVARWQARVQVRGRLARAALERRRGIRQRRPRRARPGARQPDRQRDRARRPDDRRRRQAARGALADRRGRLGTRDAAAISAQRPSPDDRPALGPPPSRSRSRRGPTSGGRSRRSLRPPPLGAGIARGARAAAGRSGDRAAGVSRRTRAFAFLGLALLTAAVAAGIADSYGSRVASGYGPLRQVVVATKSLEAESRSEARRHLQRAGGAPSPGAVCAGGGFARPAGSAWPGADDRARSGLVSAGEPVAGSATEE